MEGFPKKTVLLVEIASGIVYILASILGLLHSRLFAGGVLAGGALAIANFDLLVRLIGKAIEDPQRIKGGYLLLIAVKFLVLMAAMFALLYFRMVHPVGLIVGLSVLFIGIVAVGVASAFRDVGLPRDRAEEAEAGDAAFVEKDEGKAGRNGKGWDFF